MAKTLCGLHTRTLSCALCLCITFSCVLLWLKFPTVTIFLEQFHIFYLFKIAMVCVQRNCWGEAGSVPQKPAFHLAPGVPERRLPLLSVIDFVLCLLCFTKVKLFLANIHFYPSVCSCWRLLTAQPVRRVQLLWLTVIDSRMTLR